MANFRGTKKADGRVIQVNIYLTQKEYDDLLKLVTVVQERTSTVGARVSIGGVVRAAIVQFSKKELG